MACPFYRRTCGCGKAKCVGTVPAKRVVVGDPLCRDFHDCPVYVKKQAEIEKLL
jgi:hypothetical protein